MKKALKRVGLAMAAVFAALLLGALAPRPLLAPESADTTTRRILLLHNPIHTDIQLDADVLADFDFLLSAGIPADLPDASYLVFGWGGREFYINTPVWSELKAGPLFKGLTLDRSIMHVEVAGDIPEPQPVVTGHDLSEAGYDRLLAFIRSSFRSSPEGPMRIAGAAYGDFDGFFEAMAGSMRLRAATRGPPLPCARRACERAGGTRCRNRWPCR